ncbi:MAG TPA: DUF424 family protein [Methanoregula sp.]|nr:DUF424 family protein [Methanoregula sp.]
MFLRIHRAGPEEIVAVCDRELINTTVSNGKLTVTITEAFYGTCPASEDDVKSALAKASSINLMGERSVNVAIGMGLITREGCIMIGKIPHAQIYQL